MSVSFAPLCGAYVGPWCPLTRDQTPCTLYSITSTLDGYPVHSEAPVLASKPPCPAFGQDELPLHSHLKVGCGWPKWITSHSKMLGQVRFHFAASAEWV